MSYEYSRQIVERAIHASGDRKYTSITKGPGTMEAGSRNTQNAAAILRDTFTILTDFYLENTFSSNMDLATDFDASNPFVKDLHIQNPFFIASLRVITLCMDDAFEYLRKYEDFISHPRFKHTDNTEASMGYTTLYYEFFSGTTLSDKKPYVNKEVYVNIDNIVSNPQDLRKDMLKKIDQKMSEEVERVGHNMKTNGWNHEIFISSFFVYGTNIVSWIFSPEYSTMRAESGVYSSARAVQHDFNSWGSMPIVMDPVLTQEKFQQYKDLYIARAEKFFKFFDFWIKELHWTPDVAYEVLGEDYFL